MDKGRRIRWLRLGISIWLLGLMACSYTECSCGPKPYAALAEQDKMYDAMQFRLTAHGISFIQNQIITRVTEILQEGMVYQIARTEMNECAPGTGWPCFDIVTCNNGCTIQTQIANLSAEPVPPGNLKVVAQVVIQGNIDLSGSFDCDFPIALNKSVPVTVEMFMDARDHTLAVDVAPIQVEISSDDYDIRCPWWYDWLLESLKDRITAAINEELHNQLTATLDKVLDEVNCLPCDFYRSGCPAGSTCDAASGYCLQGGTCRVRPLGQIGQLPQLGQSHENSRSMLQYPDMFLAVGQWQDPADDPLVKNRGVEMRLVGGLSGEGRAACVPAPHPTEIPSSAPPARYTFTDVAPGFEVPYMVGVVLSDQFLDWVLYKAHLTGMLCYEAQDDETNSDTLAVLINSINTLTGNRAVPLKAVLRPTRVPSIDIGAGTFKTNADGEIEIDAPLVSVNIPGLQLDFFIKVNERFVQAMSILIEGGLELSIDFTANNRLIPMLKDDGVRLDYVDIDHFELLAEPPTSLETIAMTALESVASEVALTLEQIELPAAEGFQMVVQSVAGVGPRTGSAHYDYLGIFGGLIGPDDERIPRDTRAEAIQVLAASVTPRSDGQVGVRFPAVELRVAADDGPEAEYSWRVDDGMWHTFRPGPVLTVRDARLLIPGEHIIEVRARTPGDPTSLDPEPARIPVNLSQRQTDPAPPVADSRPIENPLEETATGCAHTSGPSHALLIVGLLLLLGRRRRSP